MSLRKKTCEEVLVRWGLLSRQGKLSHASVQTSRPGKETTTARGWNVPLHPYVVVDIHAREVGILRELVAYYVDGWRWRDGREDWGGYWTFKPDKRRRATAHKARKILASVLGIEETRGNEEKR